MDANSESNVDVGDANSRNEPGTEAYLHALFEAVFVAVHQRMGGRATPEVIDRIAREVLSQLGRQPETTWEAAEPVTATTAKRVALLNRTVRIAGHVAELRDPQVVAIRREDGSYFSAEATCARIEDRAGASIWSLDLIGDDLIEKVRRSRGQFTEYLGVMIALPTGLDAKRPDNGLGTARRDFLVHVLDVRTSSSAFDLLGAGREDRHRARELLAEVRRQAKTPLAHIKETLVANLGIVGLEAFPQLSLLIDFVIMQAVSIGWISHAPARLHAFIVGPPARGKKLIGLVARLLNPVSQELSAAHASPAGWIGASSHVDGKWTSAPGAIPRASGGVATLEDAHTLTKTDLKKLVLALAQVMEDGKARSSKAGGQTWDAEVGLVIDTNTATQAWGHAGDGDALLRAAPFLSRVDLAAWIVSDDAAAWKRAGEMYETRDGRRGAVEGSEWARDLRLLVAALRDEHPTIDLSGVQEKLIEFHGRLAQNDLFGGIVNSGDLAARMTISFRRLVMASARASDRGTAIQEDVVRAVRFLTEKLKFLRQVSVHLSTCPNDSDIDSWLKDYADREVRPGDLSDEYAVKTGREVSHRTIKRHLVKLGARAVRHGVYRLPARTPRVGSNGQVDTAANDAPAAE